MSSELEFVLGMFQGVGAAIGAVLVVVAVVWVGTIRIDQWDQDDRKDDKR